MIKDALRKNTNIITYCDYFKIFLNNPESQERIMSSEHQREFVLSSSQYKHILSQQSSWQASRQQGEGWSASQHGMRQQFLSTQSGDR